MLDSGYATAPLLPGRLDRLGAWIGEMGGRRVVISTDQASRIGELLEEAGLPASAVAELREPPAPGAIGLVHGSLSGGFVHEPLGLVVLTDRELFGATRIRRLAPSKRVVTRDLVGKLEPGDLLVHIDHGIARYAGMTQREYGGDVKEYLQLDFAGEDKIFLPADQIGRISRYSGGAGPALSKLGGTDWERTKRRVRRAVAELAEELLEIYAARESAPGFSFSPDSVWQRELEEAFPYSETPDQHAHHRGSEGRHAPPTADGSAGLRRRRLRQDRGRAARRVQGRAGREAGGRAGARPPSWRSSTLAPSSGGSARSRWRWPCSAASWRSGSRRRSWRALPTARSTC